MYCAKNQFPEFQLFRPHNKIHVARGLAKHYHVHFDPRLGYFTCTIRKIPCACSFCTSILDQTQIPDMPAQQQPCY